MRRIQTVASTYLYCTNLTTNVLIGVCRHLKALAEEHRRLREAAVGAAGGGGGGSVPWGKGGGPTGNNKPALSLLEIQQEEARVAKTQQKQGQAAPVM